MKKLFLAIAIVTAGFVSNVQAQFNAGVNVGLPLGDSSDSSSFAVMPEVNYLFNVSDQFKVGPSVSYVHYFGKSIKSLLIDNAKKYNLDTSLLEKLNGEELEKIAKNTGVNVKDASYLPVAVAARFSPIEQLSLGADLGYAVALQEKAEGGFYYRPVVAYNFTDNIGLQFSYSGVVIPGKEIGIIKTSSTNASSLFLGVLFSI